MTDTTATEHLDADGDDGDDDDAEDLVPTLVARNVHVRYNSHADRDPSNGLLRMRRANAPRGNRSEVHAVRGVNLTLHQGESIGIVGSNGSGKSTLVTALSGLIELSEGEVLAASRPALLGVGAALRPKLSGRRNIMLGLLALGLTRAEVNARMKAIIKFSGLGDAIDRPMRTYSSGMRARLAFTIATEVAPDILIIDEALAVGDRDFRARAANRLQEIRDAAGSMIVISHNLSEVASMCNRVIWLEDGEVVQDGEADEVLANYESANPSPKKAEKRMKRRAMRQRIRAREREKALEWAIENVDSDSAIPPNSTAPSGSAAGEQTPDPAHRPSDGGVA